MGNGHRNAIVQRIRRYKKIYILHSSVMDYDSNAVENMGDNVVILPMSYVVDLEERNKSYSNASIESTREISSRLDEYAKRGLLAEGVKTDAGGLLLVGWETAKMGEWPSRLPQNGSSMTIMLAKYYQAHYGNTHKVALISTNRDTRALARSLRVNCEEYNFSKVIKNLEEKYTGFAEVTLEEGEEGFLTQLYTDKSLDVKMLSAAPEMEMFYQNQCCRLISKKGDKSALAIFKKQDFKFQLVKTTFDFIGKRGVAPVNPEQCFLYHLLMDPTITLITCDGKAGTGKNFVVGMAGLELLDKQAISAVEFYRPQSVVEKGMGYLPGTKEDKFSPWSRPIFDTFSQFKGEDSYNGQTPARGKGGAKVPVNRPLNEMTQQKIPQWFKNMLDGGIIEILPLTWIRGRSISNRLMVVDEAQNIHPKVAKTAATRAAMNTKVVFIGDPGQIDEPALDSTNNGLVHVIERMKGQEFFGHITLIKSVRSPMAEVCADLL